ncbi:hypothetical protein Avbf_00985 [Armadillidium vulgare]|nr:hypothetical protein Avbf_00985 [Armadillidium vulgare]
MVMVLKFWCFNWFQRRLASSVMSDNEDTSKISNIMGDLNLSLSTEENTYSVENIVESPIISSLLLLLKLE